MTTLRLAKSLMNGFAKRGGNFLEYKSEIIINLTEMLKGNNGDSVIKHRRALESKTRQAVSRA